MKIRRIFGYLIAAAGIPPMTMFWCVIMHFAFPVPPKDPPATVLPGSQIKKTPVAAAPKDPCQPPDSEVPLAGRGATLKLKNGNTLKGDIISLEGNGVLFSWEGGYISLARDDIQTILWNHSFSHQYEMETSPIPPSSARPHWMWSPHETKTKILSFWKLIKKYPPKAEDTASSGPAPEAP